MAIHGADVRRRRQLLGWSTGELAAQCGISQQYVSFIERGDRERVSPGVFAKICDALGVTDRTKLIMPTRRRAA